MSTPATLLRRLAAGTVLALLTVTATAPSLHPVEAQSPAASGAALIAESDMRRWLSTLASDAMQGRGAFTEGYGLAAAYVAAELEAMGATPLGDHGGYLRTVTRGEYRVTRRSSLRITAAGKTQTFAQGDHVSFAPLAGSARRLSFDAIEFAGYGLPPVGEPPPDYTGKLVVLLPGTPADLRGNWPYPPAFATGAGRAAAIADAGAAGVIVLGAVPPTAAGSDGGPPAVGLTTVLRTDRPRAPVITADDEVFALLFGGTDAFERLRTRAQRGEPLDAQPLTGIDVVVDIDHRYEVVRLERTHNVVAMVPGRDPELRERYVAFGAHLDHVGAVTGPSLPGRVNVPIEQDPIWNGADDNASGSTALLAIARALLEGPRPRRSTLFVWHAAEEEGLLGSRAFVDDPPVPLEAIEAQINIDMIGRNRDDDASEARTVYVIGADRISTDLHNRLVEVNGRLGEPVTLDFHYNDPDDPESFYTRSDHYNYAARGVPAVFFFTGTHRDYHANTDSADRILYPKLLRITRYIYEAGFAVADGEPLRRDFRGPRAGRGFRGTLPSD